MKDELFVYVQDGALAIEQTQQKTKYKHCLSLALALKFFFWYASDGKIVNVGKEETG